MTERDVPLLESARSPSFIPLFSAGFAQFGAPFAENSFLETLEVTVLLIIWVSESPRELPADNIRLVQVRADYRERQEWRLFLLCLLLSLVSSDGIGRQPLRIGRRCGGFTVTLDGEVLVLWSLGAGSAVFRFVFILILIVLFSDSIAGVVVIKTQCLQGVQAGLLETIPDALLEDIHVLRSDGIGLGDDGDDGGLALEGTQDLQIKVLIEATQNASNDVVVAMAILTIGNEFPSRRHIAVETSGIENEEGSMDMGVLYARRSHHLHLFGESLLELALQERRHLPKLKVDHVLLQTFRIPEGQTNSLAIDLSLEVVGDEVSRRSSFRDEVVLGVLGALLGWESESSLEELEERSLACIASANDEDAVNGEQLISKVGRARDERRGMIRRATVALEDSLQRGGILSSANSARAIDSADGTAGVTVAPTVRHALGPRIGIEAAVGQGRDWDSAVVALLLDGRADFAVVGGSPDAGGRFGAQVGTKGLGQLLGVVGELGQLGRDARGGGQALALKFGLSKGLSLAAALSQITALTAS